MTEAVLEIEGLEANAGGKAILRGIDLVLRAGEVHALMGPNGSGKSTLAGALAGRPGVEITAGKVRYRGADLLGLAPEERARRGVFLAFQYPVEIPGVSNNYFLKSALNALRQHRGEEPLDAMEFLALLREKAAVVEMPKELLGRSLNEGFSGGEKKRNEVLQMLLLEPTLAVLDETDSGLDIDALRIVAKGVNALRSAERAMLVITHYQRLLDHIVPDRVHVLSEGRIVHSGGKELALELEERGYGWLEKEPPPRGGSGAMKALSAANERWLALCDGAAPRLGAGELARAAQLRRAGRDAFAAQGLPTTRLEAWRYTSVADLAEVAWRLPAGRTPAISRDAVEALASPVFACNLLVFADGRLVPGLSTLRAPEVELLSLAAARREGAAQGLLARLGSLVDAKAHPFAALATALLDDGVCIRLPAGARLEQPLHLVFLSLGGEAGTATQPRVFVEAGRGSHAVVVQDHVSLGAGPAFTNAVTELHVGPGAGLEHVLLQREGSATFHVSLCAALLERDARLATHTITLGGRFVRNDLAVTLAGEGAQATLNGLFLGSGERLVDNHGFVDHAVPRGTSRQLYKGVLADHSRGVFRGRVLVRPGAQRTDARQSNPNLLLSAGAEIDSKPQLEIHADDVKCSHGSAIGQSDENALFYLRTRGLDEAAARALLVRGFAAEVLAALPEPALAEALGDAFAALLEGGPAR